MKYISEVNLINNANKYLIYIYSLSCVLGLLTCILSAIVWSHWRSTLDTCRDTDCGCFFYVVTTWTMIGGSDIRICQFVSYTHLVVFFVSLCLTCYYCYITVNEENKRMRNRRDPHRKMQSMESTSTESCYTPIALSSAIVAVLLLSTAYMATEGYYKTCNEYRRTVSKSLKASGNLVTLLYERMSCTTVLDVMDYTQPNTRGNDPRGGIINTAFLIQVSLFSCWLHFILWLILLFYNAFLARKKIYKPKHEASQNIHLRTETSI